MKRTYIAAALLACTAAPAMAADVIYYSPSPSATVVTSVPAGAVVTPAPAQYYYQDQSAVISVVQKQLRLEGYSVPINGVFDSGTSNALMDFQRRRGLAATGSIDQSTLASLGISSGMPVAVSSVPVYVSSAAPVYIAPNRADSLPRNYDGTVGDGLGGLGFNRSNIQWSANY